MKVHHLALFTALAIGASATTIEAQWIPRRTTQVPQVDAFREGYTRGLRAGEDDARRNETYNFNDESDYRRGDIGYRSQYGNRSRYIDEFRRGFADGYREGYGRYGYGSASGNRGRGIPPWANGRGPGWGTANPRGGYYGSRNIDFAFANGYTEGYEAGLDDGNDNRRNAPTAEGRYRDGDRGYKREYGDRETYRLRYREGFVLGYRDGYDDGRFRR
jgi:hypothetical protein